MKRSFKTGHTGPVNSISLNSDGTQFVSGSSSGVRIVDVESGARTSWFDESQSQQEHTREASAVAFLSTSNPSSSSSNPSSNSTIAAAFESQLCLFDVRCHIRTPVAAFDADDDINSIDSTRNSYLSIADDSGTVSVLDIRKLPQSTTTSTTSTVLSLKPFKLLNAHDNIAMAASFSKLSSRPWDLWTGGFDHHLRRWDFSNGACIQEWDLAVSHANATETQSFNPPWIESISISSDGLRVAAALGSGSVAMLEHPPLPVAVVADNSNTGGVGAKKKKKKKKGGAQMQSGYSVDVVVPVHSWSCMAAEFVNGNEDYLVTGALDGKLGIIEWPSRLNGGGENNNDEDDDDVDDGETTANEKRQKLKGTWNIYRKVDTLATLPTTSSNTVRVLVVGVPLDKRDAGDVDYWEYTIPE
ncbi:WD repeat-containing protein 53 [Rhizoclosmatium sp. JEL0117]|nr:WD repeat-containing protein 53 [Rhizoclosmatium sp. JEL0117]